ncbi:MAG: AAA family ATPase [Candidatus Bipolaricaulota bacterium]|nr:AAA family ATPase [Candidatus Bipolaricaulota bacterium]
MAHLKITLFGEMEVSLGRKPLRFPTQKTKELFAYLVLHHRHAHPRAQLAALLWPNSDEERAKANLRQALTRLRKALRGTECFKFSGGAVQFHLPNFWCDVLEFEQALALTSADPKSLESTLSLYRGPFLAGVYEDWVLVEQERLQTLYLEALERLARFYTERREYDQAIKTWQRVLHEIPWHEHAHRGLIELYALKGDRAAALRQYQEYADMVQRELNAAPLPEMRALFEQLARGSLALPTPTQPLVSEMPFVGRERELAQLCELWDRVLRGSAQAVFIGGEVGVGKTTLVQRFLKDLTPTPFPKGKGSSPPSLGEGAGEGFYLFHGASYASGSELPYQPLLHAVRSAIERVPTEKLAQLTPVSRRELAQLIPEIHERFPDLEPNPKLSPAQGKTRLFAALTEFLELLSRDRPVMLFLDDLHWADDATLEYLGHLMGTQRDVPLFVIGTYRAEEALEGSRLRAWLDALGPGRNYHPLTLSRLSREETESCVERWLGASEARVSALLYSETEGNPLFLRELTRALVQSQALQQTPQGDWQLTVTELSAVHVPESLRELIAAALRRAPERARSLLGLASVIGRGFPLAVIRESLHKPEEKILDDLDTLKGAGLIVERAGHYQFAHELMRQVVYEELSADRRRLWHRRVGEALETLYPEELDALAGELTHHFERAQLWEKAIAYAMRGGAHAVRSYAYGEAQKFYSKAVAFFEALQRERALSARQQRLRLELCRCYLGREVFPTIYDVRRAADDVRRVITQMIVTAHALHDLGALCEAYQHQARLELACGQPKTAQEAMQQALAVAQRAQDPAVLADVLQGVASLRARCGEYYQATQDFQRYIEALAPLDDPRRLGYAWNDLALVQRACGDFAHARESLAKANELFQHTNDLWGQAAVANNLGVILRDLGQYAEAESLLERALALNRATGDQRGVGFSLVDLGVLRNDQGRYDEALEYLHRVIALLEQPGMLGFEIEAFSEKARAHLGRGELALALEASTRAMTRLEEHKGIVEQAHRFYFTHARVLERVGQAAEARRFLELAYARLRQIAEQIPDESLRTSLLEDVPVHREIVRAWEKAQRAL